MLLWPASDYFIKLFFHNKQTFHPSTYPTPWVTGEILSSTAALRGTQFYHKEKNSHPYFHEVATGIQVYVFVLWVEAGEPGGKPQWRKAIMPSYHTDTQIPLAWSILVRTLTHNFLVLKQQHTLFAPLDGSDSIGLIITATSASVLSNSWTYVNYSWKLFIGNWEVLFRFIHCPVFLVAVQV